MKQLELKDIQKESLDILKDVHNFCISHNIRYSLAYGTLLGAIRHKGFIPWDDDIDIMMPRPDYEQFCNCYKSGSYQLAAPKDSYLTFARVYDNKRTTFETIAPWISEPCGVNIDIFPIDAVSDNYEEFKQTYQKLFHKYMKLKRHRDTMVSIKEAIRYLNFPRNWQTLFKLIIKKMRYSNYEPAKLIAEIEETSQTYSYGTTSHIAQMVCPDNGYEKSWFDYSWMEKYVLKEFETDYFYVTAEYDKMLTVMYGNYNELPPPEMRTAHTNGHFFYKGTQ